MKKVKLQLKVKTNLKAGDNCHDAWRDLTNDRSNTNMKKFSDCCKRDSKCLK